MPQKQKEAWINKYILRNAPPDFLYGEVVYAGYEHQIETIKLDSANFKDKL